MTRNKMTAPVLAHRDGQKRAIVKKHIYIAAAVAALNLPALLIGVLALNALLGAWFALDEEVAT